MKTNGFTIHIYSLLSCHGISRKLAPDLVIHTFSESFGVCGATASSAEPAELVANRIYLH